MSTFDDDISRRDLLKGIGAASLLALLPGTVSAMEDSSKNGAATAGKKPEGATRILSANVLVAWDEYDGTEKAWAPRKALCEKVLNDQDADIICMQEVLAAQSIDFARDMSQYAQFGYPGPASPTKPFHYEGVAKNIILYKKDQYELTSAGTYWLSETPLIAGSKSWDTARARHCNWVRLKDRKTGREFRVLDAHLDHKGQTARENQAKLIAKESGQYQDDFPQLLAGDFNSDMKNPVRKILTDAGWTDTYTAIHGPKDPGRTYHGMQGPAFKTKSKHGKIDFIYCRGKVKPLASTIITENDNGKYPSDHYFVSADVQI